MRCGVSPLPNGRRRRGQVIEARQQLNYAYERFVARFGPVNLRANQRAFDGDPDLPLLLSLEHYNEETQRAAKASIFRERTIHLRQPVLSVSEPKEALLVSLNEQGRVDLDHMAGLLNKPPGEFLPRFEGPHFPEPAIEPVGPTTSIFPGTCGISWRWRMRRR